MTPQVTARLGILTQCGTNGLGCRNERPGNETQKFLKQAELIEPVTEPTHRRTIHSKNCPQQDPT